MLKEKITVFILLFLGVIVFFTFNQEYFFYNIIALLLCIYALNIINYKILSPSFIFIIMHIIQYPIAAFILGSLESKSLAVTMDEYDLTPFAMKFLILAMCGLISGIYFFNLLLRKKNTTKIESLIPTHSIIIITLLICYIFYIFFLIITKTYFHINAGEFNFDNANTFGFVGYLSYLGYVGLALQIVNYSISKSNKNLYILLLYFFIVIVFMVPSGSRRFILLPILLSIVIYLAINKISYKRIIYFFSFTILLLFAIPILDFIRNDMSNHSNFLVKFNSITAITKILDGKDFYTIIALLARRLTDYISVGFIYQYIVIENHNFIGFGDLLAAPSFLIPTLIRPDLGLSFIYDAIIMEKIGFRLDIGGSSPMMLIGDLFFRGGYLSIFIGYFIIGFIFELISQRIISKPKIFGIIIFTLMFDSLSMMHSMTILKVFVLLTKQLIIFYLIAIIIIKINNKLCKTGVF